MKIIGITQEYCGGDAGLIVTMTKSELANAAGLYGHHQLHGRTPDMVGCEFSVSEEYQMLRKIRENKGEVERICRNLESIAALLRMPDSHLTQILNSAPKADEPAQRID